MSLDDSIEWYRCCYFKKSIPIISTPAIFYLFLLIPELTRDTILGETTNRPFYANTAMYFAGAYLALGVIVDNETGDPYIESSEPEAGSVAAG